MANTTNPVPVLSIAQVAEHLGLHPRTVSSMIHRGDLGSVSIGRRLWVRADQLQALIDRHTVDERRTADAS